MNQYRPHLFSPPTLDGVELKNRVVMAPMSTKYGGTDGSVTPRNIAFYRERALGGYGLIIVEFTCVDPLALYSCPHLVVRQGVGNRAV